MRLRSLVAAWILAASACSTSSAGAGDELSGTSPTSTTGGSSTTAGETSSETTATSGPIFDVGGGTDTGPVDRCAVNDDMNAPGTCREVAPPASFTPDVQWSWWGEDDPESVVIPLVANLTDDNDDGKIDLCDVPDVVVVASGGGELGNDAHIYVLDGETGALHVKFEQLVNNYSSPALGDIDGDGLPEIVTNTSPPANLVAFEHDGTVKWIGDPASLGGCYALADLDNDGNVEILSSANYVFDADGKLLWQATHGSQAPTAADLDGDGDLEVVMGRAAYHHDGTEYYVAPGLAGVEFPQVANLDDDPEPEVLVTGEFGITLLEHDGQVKYEDLRPTNDPVGVNNWRRPATVHDFDGDDRAEYAMSSANHYSVFEQDASILWSATVSDQSGVAAGTAFDFLGDAVAEAMYADETRLFVFDGSGAPLLQVDRSSYTMIEYPVVVDVDNDGSAEILQVSTWMWNIGQTAPTIQVVRDEDDRWIQARRIWNQHTYHVTNVREDGTIPQFEPPHWEHLNTFRTNAQIEGGKVCKPAG